MKNTKWPTRRRKNAVKVRVLATAAIFLLEISDITMNIAKCLVALWEKADNE